MTNLTEQWNKGVLPEGDYYIKRRNGDTLYDNIDSHGVWRNSIDEDIIEVLAEVPSYEEWRDIKDDLATCDKDLNNVCEQKEELYEENTKLKERNDSLNNRDINLCRIANGIRDENFALKSLLKECRECFELLTNDNSPWCPPEADTLLVKINQVLGEE